MLELAEWGKRFSEKVVSFAQLILQIKDEEENLKVFTITFTIVFSVFSLLSLCSFVIVHNINIVIIVNIIIIIMNIITIIIINLIIVVINILIIDINAIIVIIIPIKTLVS